MPRVWQKGGREEGGKGGRKKWGFSPIQYSNLRKFYRALCRAIKKNQRASYCILVYISEMADREIWPTPEISPSPQFHHKLTLSYI
jgi:hypothetical protein